MGFFSKLFRMGNKDTDESINLDLIPEIVIGDVSDVTLPRGSFRRAERKVELVRVSMTMSKETFGELRRMCSELNVNASQTMRAAFHHSKPSFWKQPKMIKLFDEDLD